LFVLMIAIKKKYVVRFVEERSELFG